MPIKSNLEGLDVQTNSEEAPNQPTKTNSFWHVDKDMLKFKAHFFLYFGALAATIPFIVVFAKERLGFAASSLGAVLTAQMFLFIFTKPLIGYVADYFNKLKAIICILTIINGLGYFLLLPIPKQNADVFIKSSINLVEELFDKSDVDQYFTQNNTNFSLLEENFKDFKSEQNSCILCCIDEKKFPGILNNFIAGNKSLRNNKQFDCVDVAKNYKQTLLHRCSQINSSNVFNSCNTHSSVFGNFFKECGDLMCSNTAKCNVTDATSKNESLLIVSSSQNMIKILLLCRNQNVLKNNAIDSEHRFDSDFLTLQFWAFAILFSTSSISANAIFTLSDTACCESIQKTGADFGKQRVWGSIGWGVVAPIAGLINDSTHDFLGSWLLMATMLLVFLWNISKLDLVKPHFSQNILRDVRTVLKSKEFLIFELVILLNGMGAGMIWFYLMWFLKSIGGSDFLCGLSIAVQCFVGALPFMFFSGWIIRKLGHFQILCVSLLAYVIRFLWYSYLHNPWWVLPVEIGHGITYGLYYTVIASYGKLSAKPGTEATTQSILFSTHEGLGEGIGCILAGISFDYYGGHQTFFISAIFCACGFVVSVLLSFVLRSHKRGTDLNQSQLQEIRM